MWVLMSASLSTSDKILPIYKYTKDIYEIEDPWYTDRFDVVVKQITRCVEDILKNIC